MTACNSLHDFLNLKIFSKYGTILLVLILVVIIANLLEYNLGLRPYAYKIHNSLGFKDVNEGFTIPPVVFSWPNNMYLWVNPGGIQSDEKYLYIKGNGQYQLANLLTSQMKSNPFRAFTDTDNNVKIRIPILLSEFLDLLNSVNVTLDREQQSQLATNQYAEFKVVTVNGESYSNINKNTKFNLHMTSPNVGIESDGTVNSTGTGDRLALTLESGNIIGLVVNKAENADTIEKKGVYMMQSVAQAENARFQPIIPNTLKIKIHPDKNELDVTFNVDPAQKDIGHFLIVLAKYDYKRNLIGHLKVHTSSESDESNKNICYMDRGVRKCNYTLTDIDHIDSDGNVLYYRISVIPVDKNGTSGNYVEPTYPGGYSHFVMSKSEKEMDKIIKKVREMEQSENKRKELHEEIVSNAGGEFEYLKKQLGNYPDNLILDTNKHTLRELVNKSMALGEINVDMSVA